MSTPELTPYQLEKQRKCEAARQKRLRRIELARVRLYMKQTGKDPFPRPAEGTIVERAGTIYRVGRCGELRKVGPALRLPGIAAHQEHVRKEAGREAERAELIHTREEGRCRED